MIFFIFLSCQILNFVITMTTIEIALYYISGSICLVMAIMLLTVKIFPSTDNKPYKLIKQFLAYSALIDVITDIIIIYLYEKNYDFFILDEFFIPLAYFIQLYLMTRAILGLIHSTDNFKHNFRIFIILISSISITYIVCFVLMGKGDYLLFINTGFSKIISIILNLTVSFSLLFCIITLFIEINKYQRRLDNYFSGSEIKKGNVIAYFAYCFIGYFVLAGIDFVISDHQYDKIFMLVNTGIFIFFVINTFNLQNIYLTTDVIEKNDFYKKTDLDKLSNSINKLIIQWTKRDDKPFLKEGITISEASEAIKITPHQLSFYINNYLHINFCTWINTLRIEEAKKLIDSNPKMTFSEVAYSIGFADSATFSKSFKKITGDTPTNYKMAKDAK